MTPRQVVAVARAERVTVGPELTRLEASPATAIRAKPAPQVRAPSDRD